MRSYKKCKTESQAQAQEKEWKTTNGMEDNGMMEGETDARCSASISNSVTPLATFLVFVQFPQRGSIDARACGAVAETSESMYPSNDLYGQRLRCSMPVVTLKVSQ
jgi:hypothetical protein